MQILLSVADFEQYENDKRGIVIPLKLPKKQFYALLNLLGPCLEDHPHYHVQLQNDDRQYIYSLISSAFGKTADIRTICWFLRVTLRMCVIKSS